jgi:hypothetical protein
MELQGPEKFQDSFAKEILRFNRGGIVSSGTFLSYWPKVRSTQQFQHGPLIAVELQVSLR